MIFEGRLVSYPVGNPNLVLINRSERPCTHATITWNKFYRVPLGEIDLTRREPEDPRQPKDQIGPGQLIEMNSTWAGKFTDDHGRAPMSGLTGLQPGVFGVICEEGAWEADH